MFAIHTNQPTNLLTNQSPITNELTNNNQPLTTELTNNNHSLSIRWKASTKLRGVWCCPPVIWLTVHPSLTWSLMYLITTGKWDQSSKVMPCCYLFDSLTRPWHEVNETNDYFPIFTRLTRLLFIRLNTILLHQNSVEPQTCTIPSWILETINTRNDVTILPEVSHSCLYLTWCPMLLSFDSHRKWIWLCVCLTLRHPHTRHSFLSTPFFRLTRYDWPCNSRGLPVRWSNTKTTHHCSSR